MLVNFSVQAKRAVNCLPYYIIFQLLFSHRDIISFITYIPDAQTQTRPQPLITFY